MRTGHRWQPQPSSTEPTYAYMEGEDDRDDSIDEDGVIMIVMMLMRIMMIATMMMMMMMMMMIVLVMIVTCNSSTLRVWLTVTLFSMLFARVPNLIIMMIKVVI